MKMQAMKMQAMKMLLRMMNKHYAGRFPETCFWAG